ncbi:aspartate aminotransferase [Pseudothermotoga sp.]|nr:aspartate aminotransferase [Pseudothermotoga sp.]MCX7812527.1 aspartate aminotransferase [Pseudothermotoga sp.]MDW8138808.1 aspartate aminotransferase [Pseudothermotoga sp.]
MNISERIKNIAGSKTLEINALAQSMKQKGIDVVNLTAGEPDFPTPQPIVEAAIEALKAGLTKYTDSSGIPQLREKIAQYVSEKHGVTCTPEQVVVTNGGKQAIFNCLAALVEENDEVIIIDPCWVSYEPMVQILAGKPVHVKTSFENGFKPSLEQIERAITPNTKVIVLNSPNNPTGTVYDAKLLKQIHALAVERNIFIVSDDVYDCLVYDGEYTSIYSISGGKNVALVNAFSKSHSMTGWRVGYLVAPAEIAKAAAKVQAHTTSNINTIAQYAALKAFEVDTTYMKEKFKQRRDLVCKLLEESGFSFVKPGGAFYVLIDVTEFEKDDVTFCTKLLQQAHVALVPGSAFNAPGFVRLSFATSEEALVEGIKRLKKFVGR